MMDSKKKRGNKKIALGKVKYNVKFAGQINKSIDFISQTFLICWQIEAFCDPLINYHFKNIFS